MDHAPTVTEVGKGRKDTTINGRDHPKQVPLVPRPIDEREPQAGYVEASLPADLQGCAFRLQLGPAVGRLRRPIKRLVQALSAPFPRRFDAAE